MHSDSVFATVTLDDAGTAAVLYWARSRNWGPPLTLVDWTRSQMLPDLWHEVDERLGKLVIERRASYGSAGAFVEGPEIAARAAAHGFQALPIIEHLTKPDAWKGCCQAMAYWRSARCVAVTNAARSKMDQEPFGALSFSYSARDEVTDPTVPAYVYGVVLGLDEALAKPPKVEKWQKIKTKGKGR